MFDNLNEIKLISPETLGWAEEALLNCKYLGAIVKHHGKCTLKPALSDPFDTLISSIISQQLSLKAAATIEARVRDLVGSQFQPQAILQQSEQALRGCGLSRRKVEYLQGVAEAVETRQLDFKQLRQADDKEVIQKLLELRGVGKWTAEMFMIFSLGRIDIFSAQDVGLQRGMRHIFADQASDLKSLDRLAERWKPYRSVACWYLWKAVD